MATTKMCLDKQPHNNNNNKNDFLNQARAGLRAWFLEIAFVWEVGMCVCVCVCPPLRVLITTHMK